MVPTRSEFVSDAASRGPQQPKLIKWFSEVGMEDVASVGGKNASLGEMYRNLTPAGVNVPNGFALTATAYRRFLDENRLTESIRSILADLDVRDVDELHRRAAPIRQAILDAPMPGDIASEITRAYEQLCATGGTEVAVRSSATAEDLPEASFAGQQETFLNVRGAGAVVDACRRSFASLFLDRAIVYRVDKGFEHMKVALSVGVQRMVRSDLGASGVMFTIDTESGFPDVVLINSAYGLGENVVQGSVNPDEYYVFKPTLKQGFKPILQKSLGAKEFKLVYDAEAGHTVKNVPVSGEDRARFALADEDVLTLARWACLIEEHYGARRGRPTPMDIEWAMDGITGELFIVQARPETVQSRKRLDVIKVYQLGRHGSPVVTGRSVGEAIASGPVRVVTSTQFLDRVRPGDVLVTDKTDPDWEPVMKRAAAIVTNRGGRTCHAAIVSRELGLPAVVGTLNATESLHDGQNVTVCCAEGEVGSVYDGLAPYEVREIDLKEISRPRTRVMMNVGNPEEAFSLAAIPNDGVGLAREEFIISNYIRIHPKALLEYEKIDDPEVRRQIDQLTVGYDDKPQFFVDKLAQGAGMIAAAFYPHDVILRLSDFKTNEYANLIGGRKYEPVEENPMLGFRGASRYYDPRYRDAFALECRAVQKVRAGMGLKNLKVMIPFCRTVEEGRLVQEQMRQNGLVRGEDGLEVYVMCEIPSNVILAEEFAAIFDGFSIGSNDLTQLTLGVDRDSEIVAHVFDERNAAVKRLISQVIGAAKTAGRKIGICGQAPSDYPEFTEFLVAEGIDSISLNPDTVLKTTLLIWQKELETERSARPPRPGPDDGAVPRNPAALT